MRYCLPCNATYEANLRHCPDCGSRLLTEAERQLWYKAQEELTNQTFVPVHVLEGPVEEAILKELLVDAQVPYIVRGHRNDGFLTTFRAQMGWGVLLVPEEDMERARGVVRAYQESQVVDFEQGD